MTDIFDGFEPDKYADLEQRDGDIHLSQTTINNAQLCGGRVLYQDDPGFNHAPSEAMSWGTLVHAMIEEELRGKLEPSLGTMYWNEKVIEGLWRQTLRDERNGSWDLDDLASPSVIEAGVMEAHGAVRLWLADVFPLLGEPSARWQVEERVTECIGFIEDRAVWLGGTADLVTRSIHDWKTAGRGWAQSKADAGNQASIYTYLYGIPDHVYHVYNRKSGEWELHETVRTIEQVTSALRVAWMTAKAMHHGTLVATPWASTFGKSKRGWYCSAKFCGAWDVCQFKSIQDNVWEGQPIDIKEGWL